MLLNIKNAVDVLEFKEQIKFTACNGETPTCKVTL